MLKPVVLAIVFAFSWSLAVSAQTAAASPTPPPDLSQIKDFRPLFDERERLIDQLTQLEQAIEELSAKVRNLPPVDTMQRDLQRAQRDLDAEQKLTAPNLEKIASIQRYIDQANENLETAKNADPLKAKILERDRVRRRLVQVEQRIASLFDATRDVNIFRSIATVAFSLLVLIVVGGFYIIAYRKDGIAAKIFAGEMGMQFVTLFLIVIAIILFGIMGTLEGRELAALLGGLSGYILGKTGLKRDESLPQNPKPTPDTDPNLKSKPEAKVDPNPKPNLDPKVDPNPKPNPGQ